MSDKHTQARSLPGADGDWTVLISEGYTTAFDAIMAIKDIPQDAVLRDFTWDEDGPRLMLLFSNKPRSEGR